MTRKYAHAAFADRLQQHLKKGGYDMRRMELVRQLARRGRISVTQQTISGWLSGRHLPRPDAIQGLARMLDMDPCTLLFGSKPTGVREERSGPLDHVGARDRLLFQEFLALSAKQQEAVRNFIEALTDTSRKPKAE